MRIVLIRGLAREAEHWGEFTNILKNELKACLSDEYGDLEILTPDLVGCGVNFQMKAEKRIEDYADHLVQSLFPVTKKSESLKEKNTITPTFLVGISMGGMVALELLQRCDSFINGVVLINSSTGDQALYKRLRPRAWWPAIISILGSMNVRERIMLGVVSNNKRNFDANYRHWLSIQKKRPVTRRTIVLQLFAAARYRLEATKNAIKSPGAIFTSKQDNMVSYRCSEDLARRLSWPIDYHESAGHDLPLDDGVWLAKKISHFISSQT